MRKVYWLSYTQLHPDSAPVRVERGTLAGKNAFGHTVKTIHGWETQTSAVYDTVQDADDAARAFIRNEIRKLQAHLREI